MEGQIGREPTPHTQGRKNCTAPILDWGPQASAALQHRPVVPYCGISWFQEPCALLGRT